MESDCETSYAMCWTYPDNALLLGPDSWAHHLAIAVYTGFWVWS